jgi:hypothetical protein
MSKQWKPKFIQLPLSKMAGAPWNILDRRGFRITICGTDGNHEKDGEEIANDLLNLVALGEAAIDLNREVLQKQAEEANELEKSECYLWGADIEAIVLDIVEAVSLDELAIKIKSDLDNQGIKTEPGDKIFVWRAKYADPAEDFDIEDFFCNQCQENLNVPGDDDWITFGLSKEALQAMNDDIREVVQKHMKLQGLDKAFAWTDGPVFATLEARCDGSLSWQEPA